MSDNAHVAPTRQLLLKNKVTIQDVASAKKIVANWPETTAKEQVGYIHGTAVGTGERSAPDGSGKTFLYLKGQFEVLPTNPAEPVVQSAICYLGDAYQPMIEKALNDQRDARGAVIGVHFAFSVELHRAKNPQGYSWVLEPLTEPGAADPFAETRKLLDRKMVPQVTGPSAKAKK